jgi:hypothetical protein
VSRSWAAHINWRIEHAAIPQLCAMSDRKLKDIGPHPLDHNTRGSGTPNWWRPMPIDPKDTDEIRRALNDAAGKASVLWRTFVTFEHHLVIAFGSVKHRDLFFEPR